MKKLLLSFFSLILLGTTSLWGAASAPLSVTRSAKDFMTTSPVLSLSLNSDITISTVTGNGVRKGTSPNYTWRTYVPNSYGPVTITAATGYWVSAINFDFTGGNTGVFCAESGINKTSYYSKNTDIQINATTKTLYTSTTGNTNQNGYIDFKSFTVYYYKIPTSITLTSTQLNVGGSATIARTILPADASDSLVWESSAPAVATVDKTGKVTAVATGFANITATGIDGVVKGTCVVTVANDGKSVVETFGGKTYTEDQTKENTIEGTIATWKYQKTKRTGDGTCALKSTSSYSTWFRNATDAHIATSKVLEGGIKRVSFLWNKQSPNQRTANFNIFAGTTKDNVNVTFGVNDSKNTRQETPDWAYSHDFEVKENVALSIYNNNDNCYVLIGDIVVTPYLLYTTKSADAYVVGYKNDDLINNIPSGETVAYTLENNDGVAVINPSTGEITEILKDGTVTVKASWNDGKVYTTYQLTTHVAPEPTVSFADGDDVTKSMNVETYTNTLVFDPSTPASGCGAVTYESGDTTVATVNVNTGLVNIVGEGTATITAHIAKGSTYASKDISYELTVEDPNEEAIIEKFTAYKDGGWTSTPTSEFQRTGDFFDWNANYCRHKSSDLIGSERATIFNPDGTSGGYIVSQKAVEGGIKRIGFNWAKNAVADGQFQVIVGEDICTINSGSTKVSSKAYNHNFFTKGNATLKILNSSASSLWVGEIKITPYIYYKRNDTTILAKDYASITFTNDSLINNTGSEGSITYAIEEAASKSAIAEILDENSGAVTIHGAGDVVVKATWSEGATTTYNLHILKEKPTVTLEGATIDAFGSYTAAPTATVGGEPIASPAFSYKSSNELVATVDNSGVVTIHGTGTTNIRAILAEGDNYRSDSVEAELKVNEPVGANYWKETFDSVPDISDYITSTKTYYGNKAVYWWQMRSFQHNTSGNKDKVGSEQGIRIKFDSKNNNYIAYNRVEEGGIQAVFFNWCLAGDGTATARFSRIAPKNDTKHSKNDTLNIVRDNVTKGYNNVNSYVEVLNIDKNTRFQVRIPSGDEAVVFGPMTFKPYLLYTTKDTTINVLEYQESNIFTNDKLINNTGVEPGEDGITYSIKSVTPAGAAEILEANKHNGQVTIHGAGTAVVQAKWGEVTTTYTLRISGGDLELAFEQSHIDTTLNAEVLTNTLSGVKTGAGALTYTSDNERVAKVDKSTGVVSAMGPGDATITANVAAGTIYKAASAFFTIHVATVVEDSITETFPDYQGSPWLSNATTTLDTVHGQLGDWGVLYARHKTTDQLPSNERAVWFNTDGYIATNWAEGGIKRVSFNYEKLKSADNKRFAVIAGDIHDTIIAEAGQQEYTYIHNFFIKKNDTLKIHNISESAAWPLLVGTIKITPYLYYTIKADTIRLADYQKTLYTPGFLIDNTNGGSITYSSSNPTVATVNSGGSVKPLKASDEPVVITAKWKVSDTDSVTTSFSLKINDKQARVAQFTYPTRTVERGVTPVNPLFIQQVADDSEPDTVFVSSDTTVAKIGKNNVVLTVGPGTTTITAQISETDKCLAGSASYTLNVTYTPEAGTFWNETFSDAGDVSSYTTKTIAGDDGTPNKWNLTGFMRHTGDLVGTERGIRLRYEGNIASNIAMEGGVKEVVFNWHPYSSTYAPHFYVQVGDSTDSISRPKAIDASKVIPYAHSFGEYGKSNTSITIGNFAEESPEAQGYVVIGELNVIPYLLYTRKDTIVYAKDLADKNFKFFNDSLINNIDEGAVSYSVKAKDNAVVMDGDSVKILKAGTDTIQAAWEGVTTTYVIHVNLEDAELAFAKTDSTVLVSAGACQQVATKSTTATVTYGFEGAHEGAEIAQDGTVTFTKKGVFTILATVPVDLPYDKDTARYILTVNDKPTPEIVFEDTTVTMNDPAFIRPAKKIPASGLGQAHYTSSDKSKVKVDEASGLLTIVGEGTATISVHFDDGEGYVAADASFDVTATDPMEDAVVENFNNETFGASGDLQERNGKIARWEYRNTRRNTSDVLYSGARAIWMHYYDVAHIETTDVIEGGIKRVSFPWNLASTGNRIAEFVVMAGSDLQDKDTVSMNFTDVTGKINPDFVYNRNFSIKENAKLSLYRTGAKSGLESYMVFGDIKITPYLYYTTKTATIDLKTSTTTCQLVPDVDNRDDKDVSTIKYAFVEDDVTCATIDENTGVVTGLAGGTVTVKAYWSTNENVSTTYTVTILPSKTTINLMRNDGTEDKDVIENNIGQIMPEITLPARTGYRFNAYFIDQACTAKRFTVTTLTYTGWVSNLKYNSVTYTGDDRIWTYSGNDAVTLYADWKPERTITLDNQAATTAGTEEVITAYCPNNNLVNLMDPITVPEKENHIFLGYYTEEEGVGTQLIDVNGAFIANVAGYTDTEKNYRKWIKDEDITLYAAWKKAIILKDSEDNVEKLTPLVDGDPINVDLVRSFTAGEYNTICLPFDISKDDLATALGTTITSLATMVANAPASLDDDKKNLSIEIEEKDAVEAGKPYLIKLEAAVANPSFENMVIKCAEGSSIGESDVTFNGLLSPKSVPADKSVLFVVSKDKLAWNATGAAKNMNGMRAYFYVKGIEPSGVAARLVMRPSTPTGIENVNVNANRKMIIDNQLIIIREGKQYNAQGQIIR